MTIIVTTLLLRTHIPLVVILVRWAYACIVLLKTKDGYNLGGGGGGGGSGEGLRPPGKKTPSVAPAD